MTEKILIQDLKNLKQSEWWKYIIQQLEEELDRVTREILADWWIDPESNERKFTSYDLLRTERSFTKEIIWLPDTLISKLEPTKEVEYSEEV